MVLQIVHYNEAVLRKKGEKIKVFDAAIKEFADDMIDTMHDAEGIGLAAHQVGRPVMICVVDLRDAKSKFAWSLDGAKPPLDLFMPMVLANPVVKVTPGTDDFVYEEGCLSFPKIRGDVVRPDEIAVTFQDERGVPHAMACDGLLARCIQHEVDHLNGVLFIDRMEETVLDTIRDEVKALAKQTRADSKAATKTKV